ncbi:MAG: DNA polymerase III subunit beta [Dysgonamonadaceae bacterium]|jgi:DNA polymerase-3 subunit beta|nr:DNA polymerase III subunit beta [Dysgonamonadaceae bacterium]
MKFVVSSSALSSHLQVVSRVIASKSTIPVLDCFLFELHDNLLKITAADSETRMITSVEVHDVEGEGVFAIPSKNLLDSLKELPEQPITFDINDESFEVFIYYENGKYNFIAQNGEEYPQSKPLKEGAARIEISAEELLSGISRTLFASAEDELRPVMNGIFFDISESETTFVASDGHKLVRFKNYSVKGNEATSFILPKKPANLLKTVLPKESGRVTIGFDDNNAYISMEHIVIISRLIEGRYPNYNSVIPKENPYRVTIDRVLCLNALKRVSVFSNPSSSLIKLQVSENSIFISAQDIDFSTSAEETVACIYDGDPISIGFKGTFLIEIMNNIPSAEVVFELADPSRAGLILPSENEQDEDLLMLLMPMMLND